MTTNINCSMLGDKFVGKTSLLIKHIDGIFPIPYVADDYNTRILNVEVDDTYIDFLFWDISGQEDWSSLSTVLYPNSNVYILCFSLTDKNSFQNIKNKWFKQICGIRQHIPIILVGTKLDKRDASSVNFRKKKARIVFKENCVSKKEGHSMAAYIGAVAYVECSSLTNVGVQSVFDEVIKAACGERAYPSRDCTLL